VKREREREIDGEEGLEGERREGAGHLTEVEQEEEEERGPVPVCLIRNTIFTIIKP